MSENQQIQLESIKPFENVTLSDRLQLQSDGQADYPLYYKSYNVARLHSDQHQFTLVACGDDFAVVRPIGLPKHWSYKTHTLEHKSDALIQYRYFVVYLGQCYILLNVNATDEIEVTTDDESKMFKITANDLKVAVNVFDNLASAGNDIFRQNVATYRSRDFAVGLSIDYDAKNTDSYSISELCGYLPENNVFVMVGNYEISASRTDGFVTDTIVKRARLCCRPLVLEYSGLIDSSADDTDCFLKHNSDKLEICGNNIINVVSQSGFQSFVRQIDKLNEISAGVTFKMPWSYKQVDDVNKLLVKADNQYVEFGLQFGAYLRQLNKINIENRKIYTFIDNIFTQNNLDMDLVIHDECFGNFKTVYNILSGGYLNVNYRLDNLAGKITQMTLAKKLMTIFLVNNFIISDNFLHKMTLNKILFDFFKKTLIFRQNLDILYADTFNSANLTGEPFRLVQKGKKIYGIEIGQTLYVSLSVQSIFRKAIFLPQGKWFDLETGTIFGDGFFMNVTKSPIKYFIKENSILIEKNSKPNMEGVCDLQITIFCTDRIHKTIYESDKILHEFDVHRQNDSLVIDYNTTAICRMVSFVIVLDSDESEILTKSIIYNGDGVFFTEIGNVVKFMTSNLQTHNVIKLI